MKVFSLHFFGRLMFMLILLSASWSAIYFFTSYIHLYKYVSAFLLQIINNILGFFLFGITGAIIVRIFSLKRHDIFLQPMLEAMEHIANGNFHIDLSAYKEKIHSKTHPYYEVIKSIEKMAEELGELEHMRQEFISNVSHEIQSPLTSISGFANALQQKHLTEEKREHYLHIIQTECIRLSKLSENLLKLTTLESDKVPLSVVSYRLDYQLREVILSMEPQWTEKHIEIDVQLTNQFVHADKELLSQVWTNVIHNSIKFTPEYGKISVRLEHIYDGSLCIRIEDSGIGMSEEAQLHIFERFYKADQSRNRGISGSGLGLSIVKKIIELHGGSVEVKSQMGKGTVFVIVLPEEHKSRLLI